MTRNFLRLTLPAVATLALLGASVAPAQAADADATPQTSAAQPFAAKKFKNCTELTKKYPHGVGKKGARDLANGKPKRNAKNLHRVDNALYTANKHLDRDRDGIACER
ncbi:excalibur calcium-binding domain-containing protein [Haematomicrobium sanguinis]|uniref:excalibur calcium-binding domain-containing protein n=1 Tax=Haematomicrobium sanguinis TaxID=479106 RepID=UPI00094961D7|nr:excalibur calcium-binding domain-containing protein [Haematomicrobium sanguinis]